MPKRNRTRAEQAIDTRRILLKTARRLFARNGYHATGTHEIVDAARITRGALQHHFQKKEDLFLAVFQEVRKEWIVVATRDTGSESDRWVRLREHVKLFIQAAATPEVHRIVMIDGPAVLGWKAWREIHALDGIGVITGAIEDGIASGAIRPQHPEALVHFIIALIEEAALLVTYAENPTEAIARADTAIDTLLSNMR
jgi:AcrR family transcriptional regulator